MLGNLIEIVRMSSEGIDLYIRQAYSELAINSDGKRNVTTAIVIAIVIVATLIVVSCAYFFWSRASKRSLLA
ncbi:non-specific serine/threonine protein kinase [Trifolium repens]|nr:non-specific serine/threonine protein kinase [Trifolium repens]